MATIPRACRSPRRWPPGCWPSRRGAGALADALILLPTRRACRLLAEALLRRSASGRCCCRASSRSAKSMPTRCCSRARSSARARRDRPLRRQLLLARLFERSGWPMIHALRLAEELAALLDELQTERVPLDGLAAWCRASGRALAEQSRRSGGDCEPGRRAGRGESARPGRAPAPPAHRAGRAQWRARRRSAGSSPPARPASPRRVLLAVIATLPRGTVVLPGLDQAMDEASWRVLPPPIRSTA